MKRSSHTGFSSGLRAAALLRRHSRLVAVAVILASISVLLYPFASNFVFEYQADSLISTYEREVSQQAEPELEVMLEQAQRYNDALGADHVQLIDPFTSEGLTGISEDYSSLLDTSDTGVMAYIDIPKIDVFLPIYHGTDAATLEKGVGHLEGSSLPIGGRGTHSVLSAHTGLNSAKLFTDLVDLEQNDLFFVHVLGQTLAYQVDQILVVEPHDVSALMLEPNRDLVTLLTCTPCGVNTHRLLVRGTRVEYTPEAVQRAESVKTDGHNSQWMREYAHAMMAGIGLVGLLSIAGQIYKKRRK